MSAYILFVALSWGYGVSTQAIPMGTQESCEAARADWMRAYEPGFGTQSKALCIKTN